MANLLNIARSYVKAGLGVIPIKPDGSKQPDLPARHEFLKRLPTDPELKKWFAKEGKGIGIPGGMVSGNLETLDFETFEIFQEWRAIIKAEGLDLDTMANVSLTPGHMGQPGVHVRYRMKSEGPGPQKLASRYKLDKDGNFERNNQGKPISICLIESRGEGSYAIAPPTVFVVGEETRTYRHESGLPLTGLVVLSIRHRNRFIEAARSVNQVPRNQEPGQDKKKGGSPDGCLRPGDDYNARGPEWAEILERYGWVKVDAAGEGQRWRRPEKPAGWSATTGVCKGINGEDLFYVFSSNADPFEGGKAYSKFRAYALLEHDGDMAAAAKALGQEGYGDPRPERKERSEGKSSATDPDVLLARETFESLNDNCETAKYLHRDLMKMSLGKTPWIVEGLVAGEGLTFLGGRKKLGKSWLCMQIAQGVATGTDVLGRKVQKGEVAFIALEDGPRRLQDRFRKQGNCPDLPITIYTNIPKLDSEKGVGAFIRILQSRPKLLILDTFAAAKSGKTEENVAGPMADLANNIRRLAQHFKVGTLVTHHHGKVVGGDPGDDMRGSSAIAAAGDVNLGLYADGNKRAALKGEGRDIPPFDLALEFDIQTTWAWQLLGDARVVAKEEGEAEVIDFLLRHGPSRTEVIAEGLEKSIEAMRQRLLKMEEEGKVIGQEVDKNGAGRRPKIWDLADTIKNRGDAYEGNGKCAPSGFSFPD